MAYGLEGSRFLGIELAEKPVAIGRSMIQALGLSNIELRQGDIMDIGPDLGVFDYIIAHGVYSWVPEEVKEKLLAICRAHLAPDGVAFVSYNTYPGGHLRHMIREMMLFHVRGIDNPDEQVKQGVALLRFIAESQTQPDEFRTLLKSEIEQLQTHGKETIFHDDLAAINTPLYFHQFMGQAQEHGLQFLAEADFFEMQDHVYTPQVSQTLRQLAGNRVLREQYLDFLKCRRFRQTLLCHQEISLKTPAADMLPGFRLSSMALPASSAPDLAGMTVERFEGKNDSAMETDYPLAKAAIQILGEMWPGTLRFQDLADQARERLGLPAVTADEIGTLGNILMQTYATGLVDLHLHEPRHTRQISARPVASPVVRWQIQHGPTVTSLRHLPLRVSDLLSKKLLGLLDGSRDRAALTREMAEFIQTQASTGGGAGDLGKLLANLEGEIDKNLEKLARLSLLVG